MTREQFEQILKEKGIPVPPLPSVEELPLEADMEIYLAGVFLHAKRIPTAGGKWRVWMGADGKFRGALEVKVEVVG